MENSEENPDNKLEKNDSETVEVGSKDGSVGQTAHQASLSPTEELTAIAPSQQGPDEQVSWSPAPRTPGAFRYILNFLKSWAPLFGLIFHHFL